MLITKRLISVSSRRAAVQEADRASRPWSSSLVDEEIGKIEDGRSPGISPQGEPTNYELSTYESALPAGRVYSPEDLSFNAKRPLKKAAREASIVDKFHQLQIKPLDQYKSYNLLSEYITDLGRIRPRIQTGLSAKNQRVLARTVRRARALSLLPTTSKHPEHNPFPNRLPAQNWIARSNN